MRDANGELTGVFQEASALQLVFQKMPRLTDDEIVENLAKAQKIMHSMGYTSYTECTVGPGNNKREAGASGERAIFGFRKLQEQGRLTARVSLGFYSAVNGIQSCDALLNDLDNFPFPDFPDPNWLDMHMVKLFCDGVHMAYSAWMKNDYVDNPGVHGRSCLLGPDATEEEQEAELRRMIKLAHDRGYQVGIHTIGDRAVKAAIDSFIAAQQENPGKPRRHYLIHADSLGDRGDLFRAAKHNIGVSVQSNLADFAFEVTIERVGREKGEMLMGLRDLVDMGLHIANGSDTIAGVYGDWLHAVQAAVTRRSHITGKAYRQRKEICSELETYGFSGGISKKFYDFLHLQKAYRQCIEANRLGRMMDKSNQLYEFEDYACYSIFAQLVKQGELLYDYCSFDLLKILAYDCAYKTPYGDTLRTYLETGCSPALTAKILEIHRNTIDYRISRIRDLFGVTMDDHNLLFRFRLTFMILDFIKQSRSEKDYIEYISMIAKLQNYPVVGSFS